MAQTTKPDARFADALLAAVPKLRGLARALTRDITAADDLVQQALLKAWERREDLSSLEAIVPWTCTILRNAFKSNIRKSQTRAEEWLGHTEDVHMSAADTALSVEAREALALIDELDPELRDVLIMTAINGVSYQDAADILGCAIGTVKSRLNRARSSLRELLDGTLDDELAAVDLHTLVSRRPDTGETPEHHLVRLGA